MNNDALKISNLYELNETIAAKVFEDCTYPWEVLAKVTNRIVNEVKGVNRVMYDCTGKPPATIEFE